MNWDGPLEGQRLVLLGKASANWGHKQGSEFSPEMLQGPRGPIEPHCGGGDPGVVTG